MVNFLPRSAEVFLQQFVSLFAFLRDFAKATRINLLEEKKDESCILMVI